MTGMQKIKFNTLLHKIREVALLAEELNKEQHYAIADIELNVANYAGDDPDSGIKMNAHVRIDDEFIDGKDIQKEIKGFYDDNYDRLEYEKNGVTVYAMKWHPKEEQEQ